MVFFFGIKRAQKNREKRIATLLLAASKINQF
jgi:hypothetical protein